MTRKAKLTRLEQSKGGPRTKHALLNRLRPRVEALECRAVPTASLSVNSYGYVTLLSQTQGSTVGLSYNASSDTYTFTSSEGVAAGSINLLFNYSQVDSDTATLQPSDKTIVDFAGLEFDQEVENVS